MFHGPINQEKKGRVLPLKWRNEWDGKKLEYHTNDKLIKTFSTPLQHEEGHSKRTHRYNNPGQVWINNCRSCYVFVFKECTENARNSKANAISFFFILNSREMIPLRLLPRGGVECLVCPMFLPFFFQCYILSVTGGGPLFLARLKGSFQFERKCENVGDRKYARAVQRFVYCEW